MLSCFSGGSYRSVEHLMLSNVFWRLSWRCCIWHRPMIRGGGVEGDSKKKKACDFRTQSWRAFWSFIHFEIWRQQFYASEWIQILSCASPYVQLNPRRTWTGNSLSVPFHFLLCSSYTVKSHPERQQAALNPAKIPANSDYTFTETTLMLQLL